MPPFTKSPAALVARPDAVAARHPEARRRPMFGYPALFVGGNHATGLLEDRWVVRLAPEDAAAAVAGRRSCSTLAFPGEWRIVPRRP